VLFIRFIALATAIVVGASVLLYVVTGQPGWRRFAWRVFSVAAVAVAVALLFLLLEQLLSAA